MPRLASLLLVLTLTCPAAAQAPVQVKVTHFRYKRGNLELNIGRPVVSGLADAATQAKVNRAITEAFPPGGVAEWQRRAKEGGDHLLLEVDAHIGLNRAGVLSIHWEGLEMHSRKGQPNEAHPTKWFKGLTVDTRTGRTYTLAGLFRKGTDWRDQLDRRIAERLAKDPDLAEVGKDPGEFMDAVGEHTYSYYLEPHGLRIFNIYDNFALGAVQVTVPYGEVKAFADAAGPLGKLTPR
jgi:hypothetical protein